MDERLRMDRFNQSLDRILQSQQPGREKLTTEDLHALVLARNIAQIDLSLESKTRDRLRHRLVKQAMLQLPHASSLSLGLLLRPHRLSWLGLVILVQLVVGLIFGSMIARFVSTSQPRADGCITPPSATLMTRGSDDFITTNRVAQSSESLTQEELVVFRPVPTPIAPFASYTLLQDETVPARTPLFIHEVMTP